ncbi:MAG TPA: MFS transporter, partial [Candidatus Acidoferrales bacterium]
MPNENLGSSGSAGSSSHDAESTTFVYVAAAFAALGGLLFGYDTGVISGALIFIQKSFSLSVFHQGLVVSVVLVGAAIGALGGGKLSDGIGRRMTLLLTSLIFIAGAILCAVASSENMLVVGRAIVGLGIGLSSTTVPVYISEVSPAKARGWQVSLFQLAITVGILVAYLVDYAFAASEQWRWMLGLAVIPGAMLGLGMLYMPETPRWLAKTGKMDAARKVLQRVRGTENVTGEMKEIEATLAQSDSKASWVDLLKPNVRAGMIIGIGLAFFQQVTG